MADGWFHVEGVREGPRTLQEQMIGLDAALAECNGKRVCDLGCAEGLIAMEFSRAGAAHVYGCDCNEEMIDYANATRGEASVEFSLVNLNNDLPEALKQSYDIVLALAILHKLKNPEAGIFLIRDLNPSLVVIRLPTGSDGKIMGKQHPHRPCDVNATMWRCGFAFDRVVLGPRDEPVQYWRRT